METNKDGHMKTGEIHQFMHNNFVTDMTNEDCQYIISEFDSNQDAFIQYEEFLNIFLPATAPAVRNYTKEGYRILDKYHGEITPCVITLAARILELERNLGRKRLEF